MGELHHVVKICLEELIVRGVENKKIIFWVQDRGYILCRDSYFDTSLNYQIADKRFFIELFLHSNVNTCKKPCFQFTNTPP